MTLIICPKCGTPRAWVGWRLRFCGYEFGPGPLPSVASSDIIADDINRALQREQMLK